GPLPLWTVSTYPSSPCARTRAAAVGALVAPEVEAGAAVAADTAGTVSFVYVRMKSGEPRYQATDKAIKKASPTAPARTRCPARKLVTVAMSTSKIQFSVFRVTFR